MPNGTAFEAAFVIRNKSGEPCLQLILILHVTATFFMLGVIWFIQVVHYPLFGTVDRENFVEYEAAHMRLTGWVVIPSMILELATGVLLLWQPLDAFPAFLLWTGFFLLGVIWLSTLTLQGPMHKKLATEFDESLHRTLVSTNWIRTSAWTLRAGILIYVLSTTLAN